MTYKIGEKEYVSWSSKNQHILDKLVEREVFCCMTSEMEYMLSRIGFGDSNNPFDEDTYIDLCLPYCPECMSTYGFQEIRVGDLPEEDFVTDDQFDVDNLEVQTVFLCPVCGECYKTVEEARNCCVEESVYKCLNCGKVINEDEYNDIDTTPEEVYEWWAVSNWFGEKLKDQGCIVVESWGKSYWGRTTTGQSISLDGCVAHIAKNLEILEGMEHEWD